MSQSGSPTIGVNAVKAKLTALFPDSIQHIDRCIDANTAVNVNSNHSGSAIPSSSSSSGSSSTSSNNVPMRVYFKTALDSAHTYNTVPVTSSTTVRDVVKLLASKNKFAALEAKFALILWKRTADGVIDEQYLRDSERPANLIALWKSKGESDLTRRFYFYFAESISAGLPRPDPYVPLANAAAVDAGNDSDSDAPHSPRSALDTIKRGLNKLGGSGRKNNKLSGSLQTDDPALNKSPTLSPRATPSSPSPPRAKSPTPQQTQTKPAVASSSAAPIVAVQPTTKPNRSLTEAAALKTKVESPYRTIPSDLWDDPQESDTSKNVAAAGTAAKAAPAPSEDFKFLENLLSQPSVGGVEDMRALSPARDEDEDDDDGFRMSLIDRPREEFLKAVKLHKGSEHQKTAAGAQKPATPAKPLPQTVVPATKQTDQDLLDELEKAWLDVDSVREESNDDNVGGTIGIGGGTTSLEVDPFLQAIPAPAETEEEEESPYNQIPKGLGRPSFQKPAGQDPTVFHAKVAAIVRASSNRALPVDTEPAMEDVDGLMRELAADENVQRAMASSVEDLKALDELVVDDGGLLDAKADTDAKDAAALDEWDFESDLEKAQEELASQMAELNKI